LTFKKLNKQRKTFLAMMGFLTLVWAAEVGTAGAADFQPLIGRWQRTDGGYIIEIRGIDADGKITAGYFKVEVELRDTGYPGSRYTLIYDQPKDRLIGFYYHAVSGQNFDVVFVRQK
jgi:uncharacterized protein (DUF2147 family)